MKPTPLQIILAYLGFGVLLLGVFHKAVGLSDTVGNPLVFIGIGCTLLSLFLYRRQKTHLRSAEPSSAVSPTKRTALFCTLLALIAVISLSIPFWLPYTGTVLSFSTSVIVAIVTCILGIALFVAGWKRGQRKA